MRPRSAANCSSSIGLPWASQNALDSASPDRVGSVAFAGGRAEAAARALAWWREASQPDALAPRIAALMLSLIPVLPATSVPAVLDQAEAWMTQPSH